ncbi:MAG: NAD-dependent epimerase/dehydratase family protein [Pseudomonadales bacterium]|jgi:nucleoside-diphosphate-sugar epimerase|nr:NAD-dependent epimerase/dehydratase family protein [Pseudomonadales bacterium]
MARMLVTGATGFTGGALLRRLLADGHSVAAFVRSSSAAGEIAALGADPREVDVRDPEAVERAMEPYDCVFHLAASYRQEHADISEFREVNVEGTRHLLLASRKAGVGRFVHCSTVGIHGQIDAPPADESYRPAPNDHYQRSKYEAELLVREHLADGLPGAVLRPAAIFGPGDRRLLKLFRAIDRGFFVMLGSGRTLYHLVYIDDLVDAFLLAATREEALGETFIVAGERACTLEELVGVIADALEVPAPGMRLPLWPVQAAAVLCEWACRPLGLSPPLHRRRVEFFDMDRSFTTEKARRLLGFTPRVSLEEGIARTVQGYRAQGLLRARSAAAL